MKYYITLFSLLGGPLLVPQSNIYALTLFFIGWNSNEMISKLMTAELSLQQGS